MRRLGLDVDLTRNRPFGIDWADDIAYFEPQPRRIFDVGANVGQTARRLSERFPYARIDCFEPMPGTFALLQQACLGQPLVHCHQLALGGEPGLAEMVDGDDSAKNTLLTQSRPGVATVQVPVTTLDAVAEDLDCPTIDVLKIDAEGYETPILLGATGLLRERRVRFVVAECEFIPRPEAPHGDFREIVDLLIPLGYRVVALYCHGVNGNGWGWGDVLLMLPSDKTQVAVSPFRS